SSENLRFIVHPLLGRITNISMARFQGAGSTRFHEQNIKALFGASFAVRSLGGTASGLATDDVEGEQRRHQGGGEMSPRFTQKAQGGGKSPLIPVPRGRRISSAAAPGRRRGAAALVSRDLREEERDPLIPVGVKPEFCATTPGRRRGAVALVSRGLREEERDRLIPVGVEPE
ncbi:hypothetical protein, partial [Shimia marina]|uniref:hypothetical protein n=1 Tax=Shimia marina TaxID=321267 RepID=UPI001F2F9962